MPRARILVFIVLLSAFLSGVSACQLMPEPYDRDNPPPPSLEPTPTRVGMYVYSNPTAFDMHYPAGWTNNIVKQGVMVIAPPEVASLDAPGPSVTIYRVGPGFSDPDLDLNVQLEEFLNRGPLSQGFVISSEILPRDLGQYSGYTADIEREETAEGLNAMHGRIVVVRADTKALYYVMATAPSEMWEDNVVFFTAIYQSMLFNE